MENSEDRVEEPSLVSGAATWLRHKPNVRGMLSYREIIGLFSFLSLANGLTVVEACFKKGEIVEGICIQPNGMRREMRHGEEYSSDCEPTTGSTDWVHSGYPYANVVVGAIAILGIVILWSYFRRAENTTTFFRTGQKDETLTENLIVAAQP